MSGQRAGFVSFVGRPNVGKSTLMNALVGEKVAITSDKPQTTRRAIRGVVTIEAGQLVIVDTPGLHRPRTLLGERLNDLVEATLGDVDVIAFCVPADEKIGPGDRFIAGELAKYPKAKKVAIVTKLDKVGRSKTAEQLLAVQELAAESFGAPWDEIVPVSALTQQQLGVLTMTLVCLMPVSAPLYDDTTRTEERPDDRIAELIREAALQGVEDELPHSIAVTVTEEVGGKVFAELWVERDSQKGIVIGKGGQHLKAIRQRAERQIGQVLGRKVKLDLHVKVAKEWQRDPKQLGRLGF